MKVNHIIFFAILFLIPITPLLSQSENAPDPTLESPYNTMYVHLHYLQPDSYEPAIAARTLYNISDSSRAEKLAIKLKQIFDGKGLYVHLNLLPQETDYVDTLTKKEYFTPFPKELPQVYLEKHDDKWYYADATINDIEQLHKSTFPFGTSRLLNILPHNANNRFLGLALWQYLGIAILLLVAWLVFQLLSMVILPMVRRIAHSRLKDDQVDDTTLILKVARIISFIIVVNLLKLFIPVLQFPAHLAEWILVGLKITSTILVVVFGLRVLRLVMVYAKRFAQHTEHRMDEQLLPIVQKLIAIVLVIGGIIQVLRLLDVNVTALIAGVSIGGLALALAAQDTVKNLIGSAMIFIDRPFQIGDYIDVGGMAGTVTEVGFRSTRVRKMDSSIISIPNGNMANLSVTNLGVRVFRVMNITLGVTYDTPPEKIKVFIEGLKKIILDQEYTKKDEYYVYLSGMSDSSIDIMFRAYLVVPGYIDELETKQNIYMQIITLADSIGVNFAFPSRSLYVEQMPNSVK